MFWGWGSKISKPMYPPPPLLVCWTLGVISATLFCESVAWLLPGPPLQVRLRCDTSLLDESLSHTDFQLGYGGETRFVGWSYKQTTKKLPFGGVIAPFTSPCFLHFLSLLLDACLTGVFALSSRFSHILVSATPRENRTIYVQSSPDVCKA